MLIKVTKDHINRGKKRSSDECPIALAISEKLDMHDVEVNDDYLRIESCSYFFSDGVKRWIDCFDSEFFSKDEIEPKTLKLTDEKLLFSNKRNFK